MAKIGTSENDTLSGGRGDDEITGTDTVDVIRGRKGNDILKGGGGNDVIFGGKGRDLIYGGNIDGDGASDVLFGGKGKDVFILMPGASPDTIADLRDNDIVFYIDPANVLSPPEIEYDHGSGTFYAGGQIVGYAPAGTVFDDYLPF